MTFSADRSARRILGTLIVLAAVCGVLAFVCALSSCAPKSVAPAIPKADNRDARGRYLTPACPLCGAPAVLSCTTYRCAHGHKYESPDLDLECSPSSLSLT